MRPSGKMTRMMFTVVAIELSYVCHAAAAAGIVAGVGDLGNTLRDRGSETHVSDIERVSTEFEARLAGKDAGLLAIHKKLAFTLQKLAESEAQLAKKEAELIACRSAHTAITAREGSAVEHRRRHYALTASIAHTAPTSAHQSRSILEVDLVPQIACTLDEVTKVGTASDKASAVLALLGSNAPCGQCLMGCATAKDATSCAMACTTAGLAATPPQGTEPPPPPAVAEAVAPCTVAEVMGVGTAADKGAVVMALMGTNAPCSQCIMACASAADSTSCALACASSSDAAPSEAGPSPNAPTGQGESGARSCSKAEADSVLRAPSESQVQVVVDMFGTNLACASCMVPCAGLPNTVDAIGCLLACQHQNENRCEDTTRIAHLIEKATFDDRDTLVRMLELSEALCVYCILETYASSLLGRAPVMVPPAHISRG
jgi:hypothetical protein